MFADDMDVLTIVGEATSSGVEGTINIGLNGGIPAASIQVPQGKKLVLTDILGSAAASPCEFIVQKSRDGGANWFNVMLLRTAGQTSNFVSYESPRVIKGGAQTFVRVRQLGTGGDVSITLSGWFEDSQPGKGVLSGDFYQPSMTGRDTTAGAAEQTLPIGVDYEAPASALQVPVGMSLEITDWVVCAPSATIWRIQQSDDGGVSWYDRAIARVPGSGPSQHFKFQTPINVIGADGTQIRLRVTTPAGASDVDCTLGVIQRPAGVAVVPIP